MQQWEIIRVKDYVNTLAATASKENPVDLTVLVRGNQFHANDTDENDKWTFKALTKTGVKAKAKKSTLL